MYLMDAPSSTTQTGSATPSGTHFHPGVHHDHSPTGRWADVQRAAQARCAALRAEAVAHPGKALSHANQIGTQCACANLSPEWVARTARNTIMAMLPMAQRHLDHYIAGSGSDLRVDLEDIIRRDGKVRSKLAAHVKRSSKGHFRVEQSDYAVKDFQFALGALDRLDFEVNDSAGVVHIWFKDRYEWHPVGFGYKKLSGDSPRPTNCVHAAMVELKSSGANDYWMVGDAVIPLTLLGISSRTAPYDPHTPRPRPRIPLQIVI